MSDNPSNPKNTADLFRDLDLLCEEVFRSLLITSDAPNTRPTPMQQTMIDNENKEREERKQYYLKMLDCQIIDLEIQPLESPRSRADFTVKSSLGRFSEYLSIAEIYILLNILTSNGFELLSTGKVRRERNKRDDDDRIVTWFILRKTRN